MKHYFHKVDDNYTTHMYAEDNLKKLSSTQIKNLLNIRTKTRAGAFEEINNILNNGSGKTRTMSFVKETNDIPNFSVTLTKDKTSGDFKLKELDSNGLNADNPETPMVYEPFTMNDKGKIKPNNVYGDNLEEKLKSYGYELEGGATRGAGATGTAYTKE